MNIWFIVLSLSAWFVGTATLLALVRGADERQNPVTESAVVLCWTLVLLGILVLAR